MARLSQIVLIGYPQRIIILGNNRQLVFSAAKDYRFFLKKFGNAALKHPRHIHAYVLMTNHNHLLATPHTADGISKRCKCLVDVMCKTTITPISLTQSDSFDSLIH